MATSTQIDNVTTQINTLITDQHNEEITGTIMNTVLHLIKDLAPVVYTSTFDNGDLDVDFQIDVEHNLGTLFPDVKLIDGNGKIMGAANAEFTVIDEDTVRIGMGALISGTYSYIILKHD